MTEPVFALLTSAAELGAAIRQARTGLDLGLRPAAERCGVGVRFLRELEAGKPTARLDKVLAVLAGMRLLAIVVPYEAATAALRPQR